MMPGQQEETGGVPEKVFQLGFEAKAGVLPDINKAGRWMGRHLQYKDNGRKDWGL